MSSSKGRIYGAQLLKSLLKFSAVHADKACGACALRRLGRHLVESRALRRGSLVGLPEAPCVALDW